MLRLHVPLACQPKLPLSVFTLPPLVCPRFLSNQFSSSPKISVCEPQLTKGKYYFLIGSEEHCDCLSLEEIHFNYWSSLLAGQMTVSGIIGAVRWLMLGRCCCLKPAIVLHSVCVCVSNFSNVESSLISCCQIDVNEKVCNRNSTLCVFSLTNCRKLRN